MAVIWLFPALFSSCSRREDLPPARESQIYIQRTKYPIQPSLDLFCFDTAGLCRLDSYQQVPILSDDPVYAFSTRGPRYLVAFSGLTKTKEDWVEIRTLGDLRKLRFSLEDESPSAPLLVGETLLEDAPSRQVSLSLSPALVRIRLKSLSADFSSCSYVGTPFLNTSLYLGFAVTECLPLGGEGEPKPKPLSWVNTGPPDSVALRRLPFPEMLLQEGVGPVDEKRIYPERDFYCYPGPDTRLVLAGSVGEDICYYPVPLPELKAGRTYNLHLTLRRKGSLDPSVPVTPESVKTELLTVPWEKAHPYIYEP